MNRRRLLTLLGLLGGAGYAGYASLRNPYYNGPVSDHFDGLRFHIPNITSDKSTGDLLKWQIDRNRQKWPERAPGAAQD